MRQIMLASVAFLLMAVIAFGQNEPQARHGQSQAQQLGRGRGGAPFAWNDRDRDGICDITGQPVGQRAIGFGRGQGRGMWTATAQPAAAGTTVHGRGRGGVPFAWNDRNRDGICDLTGRPVRNSRGGGRQGNQAMQRKP